MEGQLSNDIQKAIPLFKYVPTQWDHIILTDDEKDAAIEAACRKKARRENLPVSMITLLQDEIAEVLRLARSVKAGDIAFAEYSKRVAAPKEYPIYTAEQLEASVIETANREIQAAKGKPDAKYILNEDNQFIIKKLSQYFTNDPAFEEGGYSHQKGIMLIGPVGCGKTMLMRLFRQNQRQSYHVIGCQIIGLQLGRDGYDAIIRHTKSTISTENRYGQTEYGTCFDDVGAEDQRKYYGDTINAMQEIIEGRYIMGRHYLTHLTTNLDGQQFENYYGLRCRSRLREMCNVFMFDAKSEDLRK